jgi:branched-subunit amino acid aminotransferase/4-amino-4-deoxychorismate lyase
MIETIKFRTMPFDDVGATMDRHLQRLERQAEAYEIAIRVAVERKDEIAEAHARAGLSNLLERIRELQKGNDGK